MRKKLTVKQLLSRAFPERMVENSGFEPANSQDGGAITSPLSRRFVLVIPETPLQFDVGCVDPDRIRIHHQRIDLFPCARITLVVNDTDLIPVERDLIHNSNGKSYWDLTVSPGRVWIENEDAGWSRAALPFQLSNIFENDTHHGIATFVYDENKVSPVYVQIVAETKSFLCPDGFYPRGFLDARVESPDSRSIIGAARYLKRRKKTIARCCRWKAGEIAKQKFI